MAFRFVTAGESHGPGLVAIVEGLPAGLELDREALDREMARRQLGHGRGGRMKIESDSVEIRSGVRHGRTLGSPIAVLVANRDYANWEERMNPWPVDAEVGERRHAARPGHADLAGLQKYGHSDVRNVLERASARETAARVAAGIAGEGVPDRARRQRPQPRDPDRLGAAPAAASSRPRTSPASTTRRSAASTTSRLGGDGRGDQPAAQGQREPRRHLRGARLRARPGTRLARLLGGSSTAAWPRRSSRSSRSRASRSARPGRSPGGRAPRPTTRSSTTRSAAGTARPIAPAASRAG